MTVATQMADNQTGNFAAKVCADYSVTVSGVTYGDWYLPSKYELNLLYLQKVAVGGFASAYYWSSTENNNNNAWIQNFDNGNQNNNNKNNTNYVRAVRDFEQTIFQKTCQRPPAGGLDSVFFLIILLCSNSHYSTYHKKKNQKLSSKNYLKLILIAAATNAIQQMPLHLKLTTKVTW